MNKLNSWLYEAIKTIDYSFSEQAKQHQDRLTKPPGSLGELENIAIKFATWQQNLSPELEKIQILIYAADHGIAAENVSAFPQAVTAEMIKNFSTAGAAISVLARLYQVPLKIINMGTIKPLEPLPMVVDCRIGAGTQSFVQGPAMTMEQMYQALECGKKQAEWAQQEGVQLLVLGEMGIANTTSAAALGASLFGLTAEQITGRGTGLDDQGIRHKIKIIDSALQFHHKPSDPLDCLRVFGGFEIAAMTGSYLRSAQLGLPILIDGFITTIAAVLAIKINPRVQEWMLFAHCSAEQGHQLVLDFIQSTAILNLNMRLGEGSGAAVAIPILRAACALNNQMATFEQAEVSNRGNGPV